MGPGSPRSASGHVFATKVILLCHIRKSTHFEKVAEPNPRFRLLERLGIQCALYHLLQARGARKCQDIGDTWHTEVCSQDHARQLCYCLELPTPPLATPSIFPCFAAPEECVNALPAHGAQGSASRMHRRRWSRKCPVWVIPREPAFSLGTDSQPPGNLRSPLELIPSPLGTCVLPWN